MIMGLIRGSEYKEFELMANHMLALATRGRGAQEVAVWRGSTDPGRGDATALPRPRGSLSSCPALAT